MLTNAHELVAIDCRSRCNQRSEILHWDGRLDNRDDLILRLRDSLGNDTSNTAIVRAAYERWGTDGFVHLIGDWSVVIRDYVSGTTVLGSDFAGVRPLYYHVRPGGVSWSGRLQPLVDQTGISELDEQYIAAFLRFGGCPNRTPYQGIYSVPPGHAVCVSSEQTSIRRFWQLPIGNEIRYQSERQYEEHLRALFREAVAVRLQTESSVLAELSGGLDSSSVVCMANHLIRNGAVPASGLTGLSFVWQRSLDEPFIREVESHCGIEGVHISTHDDPLIAQTQPGSAIPEPFQPLRESIAGAARRLGVRTILTGQNGDLMMGNWFDDSLQVAKALRHLRFGRACGEALAWSKILRLPIHRILWRAFQAALPPTLSPTEIYTAADGSYAPKNNETSLLFGSVDRESLIESESLFSNDWMQARPERRKYFHALSTMLELRMLQPGEPLQHLDYTHPFAHRPLVEFLMTIPVEVLCRPGEPRRLMRSAFSDLWPLKVRNRRSKCLFNAPWQEALRPVARALLSPGRLHLVERGFVDRSSFLSRLEKLCVGLECNDSQLRQIIMLELWLRNRADDGLAGEILRAA